VEELLTAHPHAIFVKDRKGRTPLQCGLAAASAAAAHSSFTPALTTNSSIISTLAPSVPSSSSYHYGKQENVLTPGAQKAIFSVLELYTQISISDQLQKAMNSSRAATESRIGAVEDRHAQTLTQLKGDWERQRNELGKKIQSYKNDLHDMRSEFAVQQEMLEEKVRTELELVDKLQQVTMALEAKTVMDDETVQSIQDSQGRELVAAAHREEKLRKTNQELLHMLENLLEEQSALKVSMDKLSWETAELNQDRQELLDKYLMVQKRSRDVTSRHNDHWQQRLEKSGQEISAKLAGILGHAQQHHSFDNDHGEEKKDSIEIIHDL